MYHSLGKYIPAFIFIFVLLGSCSSMKAKVNFSEKNYETDISTIELEIPEFKNFPDSDFEEKLNGSYTKAISAWVDEFTKKCGQKPSEAEKCQLKLSQEITFDNPYLLSIVGELYTFTKGMHGTTVRIPKNIDVKNCRELKLSDLFSDESYKTAINREINEILENNPDKYSDLWEKPVLSSMHEEYFYFSGDGLVIFFPPYELSYYARGFVDFCIPYSGLSGYYSPDYRFIGEM